MAFSNTGAVENTFNKPLIISICELSPVKTQKNKIKNWNRGKWPLGWATTHRQHIVEYSFRAFSRSLNDHWATPGRRIKCRKIANNRFENTSSVPQLYKTVVVQTKWINYAQTFLNNSQTLYNSIIWFSFTHKLPSPIEHASKAQTNNSRASS